MADIAACTASAMGACGRALLQVGQRSEVLVSKDLTEHGAGSFLLLGSLRAPAFYRAVFQSKSIALGSFACAGGGLHGIALAVRKHYSADDARYWLQPQWWFGFLCDICGCLLIWPAVPIVAVELLMPMVLVTQLIVSYVIGLLCFGEKSSVSRHTGMLFSILGTVGLSISSPMKAENFEMELFWTRSYQPAFLWANVGCTLALSVAFCFADASTFWALLAAFAEAMQYILTRVLAGAFFVDGVHLGNPAVQFVLAAKAFFFVMIIICQQRGLAQGLSRFSGVYLVATAFLTCTHGAAFFGDSVALTDFFVLSALCTLLGVWLLGVAGDDVAGKHHMHSHSDAGASIVRSTFRATLSGHRVDRINLPSCRQVGGGGGGS